MFKYFIILIFLNLGKANAQNIELSVCKPDSSPMPFANNLVCVRLQYNLYDSIKIKITDSLVFNNKKFYAKDDAISSFITENENGEVYNFDEKKQKEVLLIPQKDTLDYEIEYKGMMYKVIDYHIRLKTPFCEYDDVIMILFKPKDFYKYFGDTLYYKRGIGFVAIEEGNKPMEYLVRRYIEVKDKD